MAIRPRAAAPDWSEKHHRGAAKCRTLRMPSPSDDVFFESATTAMDICNGAGDGTVCPRRTECLRIAMLNAENFGIWGGMTPKSRLELRLRYPGMPERWAWRPEPQPENDPEELPWLAVS